MSALYTARATAFSGREGRVVTYDKALDVFLVRPKEMGGPGQAGTNPEQLFAAGYAACFGATLQVLARGKKLTLTRNEVIAHIGLNKRTEGGYILSAELDIVLGGVTPGEAAALVDEAHNVCPYSNSIKQTLDVAIRHSVE